jgi:hypothetical protein
MLRVMTVIVLLGVSVHVHAVEYRCKVEKKLNFENVYSQPQIKKSQFSVIIEERAGSAFLSRCSFSPSAEKVTCDRYEVDKIVFDEHVKIKKYYVLRSHFDVQVFPDLSFVENNGRGDIAFGKCNVVAPW